MPPKLSQLCDKDGKFLPKNRQPPASPTHSASCACSTSCSHSKQPEQPLKSPPKEPSSSKSKEPESPAETITINLKQSQAEQCAEDHSLPTQDSSKSWPSLPEVTCPWHQTQNPVCLSYHQWSQCLLCICTSFPPSCPNYHFHVLNWRQKLPGPHIETRMRPPC